MKSNHDRQSAEAATAKAGAKRKKVIPESALRRELEDMAVAYIFVKKHLPGLSAWEKLAWANDVKHNAFLIEQEPDVRLLAPNIKN